ncbi:Hsp70 family protein [Pedobacter sp. LMG 31464]|uniref:Hsp70 family protein n=1 Tax=Pedobacter planticolens TaxID=2679964 RepID=A0A923E230_9SPHI|nr:Hsp70 family protein [Pedobacter planticolens]MBB2146825.1 Hsp70 family protein [Pedobacter planticolens]
MSYNFYEFNSGDFENLVQALFQKILGNSSLVFGLGADGARELTFQGRANFHSPTTFHNGLWIVQAKFKSRDVHDHDQYQWVRTQFIAEMRKFKSGNYPLPDQYIFVTNSVLSPGYLKGGRDKIEKLIDYYRETIPNIYVIAYDELCAMLTNNADVRLAYEHFLQPGDRYKKILQLLENQQITHQFVVAGNEIRPKPSQHNYAVLLPQDPILTIDFGTSYSMCGLMSQRGQVELVPALSGGFLLHSVLSFFNTGNYIVGNPTLKHVDSSEIISISHIKRQLGAGKNFEIFGSQYTPEQLGSLIIRSLKISAEEFFGCSFKKVVVAKPANFSLRQSRALKDAFAQAGLNVMRMHDEGTSPCYLLPKAFRGKTANKEGVKFIVIDLGGGTLDLSVQEFEDGVYDTKAILGDNTVGGVDYDYAILNLASQRLLEKYPELRGFDFNKVMMEAERLKKVLSSSEQQSFIIADQDDGHGNLIDYSIPFTRDDFRACTSHLNVQVMRHINNIMRAGSNDEGSPRRMHHIDAVMLTGQGAKIFTVKEIINELFTGIPIIDQFMENAVCLGNAYQAGVLNGIVREELLLSVHNTGFALKAKNIGRYDRDSKQTTIEVNPMPELNTIYSTLLAQNTTIPCTAVFLLIAHGGKNQPNLILPLFEVMNSTGVYDQVIELSIPITSGKNTIGLSLVIDANYKISLSLSNPVIGYQEVISL